MVVTLGDLRLIAAGASPLHTRVVDVDHGGGHLEVGVRETGPLASNRPALAIIASPS